MAAEKLLIVNADDFGRTAGINAGIIEAHTRGIVTSATLMVTGPAAKEAAELARQHSLLGVGLHLALTGGRPVLERSHVESLVDRDGSLPPRPDGLVGAAPSEILLEARAQMKRFRELMGKAPTHIDSHHNAHRLPAVLEAVVTLSWETGLPVRSISREMRVRFGRERIATNDRFVDSFYDSGATLEGLLKILSGLNRESTEIMCHPAHVDEDLRGSSGYVEGRGRELEVLVAQEVRHAVQAAGIQLVHYGSLAAEV